MKMSSIVYIAILLLPLVSCVGEYSTLSPAGTSAKSIADIFWWMAGGATLIWLFFVALCAYTFLRPGKHNSRKTSLFIIGGGVVFPTVVLTVLVYFSLNSIPELVRPAPAGSLKIEVSGLQWWWRIRYQDADRGHIELANEIRLPVNEPVQFSLSSEDVIHSFWIPSLAGKVDMIPGHETQLAFTPTKTGTFGAICAEFCGASHALMKMKVVVMEKAAFDEWLTNQTKSAVESTSAVALRGKQSFISHGCLSCHTVRGVGQAGKIAPDLTHVGSRLTLGAGIFPNDLKHLHQWVTKSPAIKPEVKMPAFDMIPHDEREAMATWLQELK